MIGGLDERSLLLVILVLFWFFPFHLPLNQAELLWGVTCYNVTFHVCFSLF